jgi:tetratricopeptide (TPR) repeat protein
MDSLITAAARALAGGDPLAALKRVALRDDAPALALRGIAMAQMGDLVRARDLLRRAAGSFGTGELAARARCRLAEAEIALVSRDLTRPAEVLNDVRMVLDAQGDRTNAAHAAYLEARRLLLIGRLDAAEGILEELDPTALPHACRAGAWLVAAGIAMRRIRTDAARAALENAAAAAQEAGIPGVTAEVDRAVRAFDAPAARLIRDGKAHAIGLGAVEDLFAADGTVVDACRNTFHSGAAMVPLGNRPILFTLLRVLAEAYPGDASRADLLARTFGAKQADESHRARLRVEIGRLRAAIRPHATIAATSRGFALKPVSGGVAVLAPPVDGPHPEVMALLADGEAWSSSALAMALDVSPRTVQRALDSLARDGAVERFGRGRACRWIASAVPGFPTSLLLPAPTLGG